jgi:hypothetical protein
MIRKTRQGKYRLYSHNMKPLGTFGTRQAAGRRERQIVYFKHPHSKRADGWWAQHHSKHQLHGGWWNSHHEEPDEDDDGWWNP